MPINYNIKKKTWDFHPESQEEADAYYEIGKTVIIQKLSEKFVSEMFEDWMKLSKKHMFKA